ncbi:hypothetical protein MMC07_004887 [Pseudocyphellaria aurata]|nr:hypothetical protein [Pseudocyphellaria aurata]
MVLVLCYRALQTAISMFLTLALTILVLEPFDHTATDKAPYNRDQDQAAPAPVVAMLGTVDSTVMSGSIYDVDHCEESSAPALADSNTGILASDKPVSTGNQGLATPTPTIIYPEIEMSRMDIQRLIKLERRRDARISEVEKGCRRERRQICVDKGHYSPAKINSPTLPTGVHSNSMALMPELKHPKPITLSSRSEAVVRDKSPSPPNDLTSSEFASNIKTNSISPPDSPYFSPSIDLTSSIRTWDIQTSVPSPPCSPSYDLGGSGFASN